MKKTDSIMKDSPLSLAEEMFAIQHDLSHRAQYKDILFQAAKEGNTEEFIRIFDRYMQYNPEVFVRNFKVHSALRDMDGKTILHALMDNHDQINKDEILDYLRNNLTNEEVECLVNMTDFDGKKIVDYLFMDQALITFINPYWNFVFEKLDIGEENFDRVFIRSLKHFCTHYNPQNSPFMHNILNDSRYNNALFTIINEALDSEEKELLNNLKQYSSPDVTNKIIFYDGQEYMNKILGSFSKSTSKEHVIANMNFALNFTKINMHNRVNFAYLLYQAQELHEITMKDLDFKFKITDPKIVDFARQTNIDHQPEERVDYEIIEQRSAMDNDNQPVYSILNDLMKNLSDKELKYCFRLDQEGNVVFHVKKDDIKDKLQNLITDKMHHMQSQERRREPYLNNVQRNDDNQHVTTTNHLSRRRERDYVVESRRQINAEEGRNRNRRNSINRERYR